MSTIVLICSILILITAALNPKLGVFLTAATLPIIGRDFYFANLVVPAADLIALLTLIGFFVNLTFTFLFKTQKKVKLIWPLFFPFLLFFLVSILSAVLSNNPIASLYYFMRWPLFLYFAYIFVPANVIKDAKTLKTTVVIVFLSAMAVLLSGFLSLYGQDWQNSFFRLKSIKIFGSYPFGENHNLIAEFLNIGAFFVLVIKEFLKDKRLKRIADTIFIIAVLGIILTFSRSGWITLFLQSAIYLYYRAKAKPKEHIPALIISLLFIALITPLFFRMSALQEKNISSTENRVLLTEISLRAFKEKPILGHGSGEFTKLVDQNTRFKAKYGPAVDSHGVIQKIIAENGILGLTAWLFLLFVLINLIFKTVEKYYPRVKWVLPFALAVFGGVFFQFFNTSYFKGKVWFPILLFILALRFSEEKVAAVKKGRLAQPGLTQPAKKSAKKIPLTKKSGSKKSSS